MTKCADIPNDNNNSFSLLISNGPKANLGPKVTSGYVTISNGPSKAFPDDEVYYFTVVSV